MEMIFFGPFAACGRRWRCARFLQIHIDCCTHSVQEKNRSIIFIGHSFGGLIVKQALVNARADDFGDRNNICQQTRGLIFLGTPHKGANLTIAGRLLSLLGHWRGSDTSLLRVVERDSIINQDLHSDFMIFLREYCGLTNTVCIFEAVKESLYGFPIVQVSTLGFDRGHRDIQRFTSPQDENYQDLLIWIKKWLGEGKEITEEKTQTETVQNQNKPAPQLSFPDPPRIEPSGQEARLGAIQTTDLNDDRAEPERPRKVAGNDPYRVVDDSRWSTEWHDQERTITIENSSGSHNKIYNIYSAPISVDFQSPRSVIWYKSMPMPNNSRIKITYSPRLYAFVGYSSTPSSQLSDNTQISITEYVPVNVGSFIGNGSQLFIDRTINIKKLDGNAPRGAFDIVTHAGIPWPNRYVVGLAIMRAEEVVPTAVVAARPGMEYRFKPNDTICVKAGKLDCGALHSPDDESGPVGKIEIQGALRDAHVIETPDWNFDVRYT
ncbi:predicted protein [Uncinocarpus reesii 1704]|uniref:GPI inositol-deacylase n=1 Tax=Uncinocarpus reesii (strain UAMH 1704) TaxID=336963 RepID=C4JDB7_UNCRE|nr:uncharacterized protein UREG_00353 [Uncinocarpus reesii 1704]EEP75507.1 predicted protein [Uncinocarpus reesii 1704]